MASTLAMPMTARCTTAWLLRENDSLDGDLFSSPNPEPTFATALKLSWVNEL
jgi:hypothetical protein